MNINHDDVLLNEIAIYAIPDKSSDCRTRKAKKQWQRNELIKQIKEYTSTVADNTR